MTDQKTEQVTRVGLIGSGIQLSRTPAMHEAEAQAQGLTLRYELIDTDQIPNPDLGQLLLQAEQDGFAGVNVTHPYKQEVLAHLDEMSDAAKAIGAVNTVVFDHGRRIGHNTDCWGFAQAFRRDMAEVDRREVLQLGAGGAGAAVATALLQEGVERLLVFDQNAGSADALVARLQSAFGSDRVQRVDGLDRLERVSGVVNTTPVGMAAHPGTPVPVSRLSPAQWVADVIYFPLETELLAGARRLGCVTLDGTGMAVFQAVRAFELFTGMVADAERMREVFDGV